MLRRCDVNCTVHSSGQLSETLIFGRTVSRPRLLVASLPVGTAIPKLLRPLTRIRFPTEDCGLNTGKPGSSQSLGVLQVVYKAYPDC